MLHEEPSDRPAVPLAKLAELARLRLGEMSDMQQARGMRGAMALQGLEARRRSSERGHAWAPALSARGGCAGTSP